MVSNTSSLGFAAYLLLKGHKLVGTPIKDRLKYRFAFDAEPEQMNSLYQEYIASDYHNFDTLVQNLKRNLKEPREDSPVLSR